MSGCGGGSSDNPVFRGQATGPAPPPVGTSGPILSTVAIGAVTAIRLESGPAATAINIADAILAGRLGAGGRSCTARATRSDQVTVSFRWSCSDRTVATATYVVATGTAVTLPSLFGGDYLHYLSSTASAQLAATDAPPATVAALTAPTAATFALWDLTPDGLEVTFPLPSGPAVVGFPLATLAPYRAATSVLPAG